MADTLAPPLSLYGSQRSQNAPRRRVSRQSHASYSSWISSLAAPVSNTHVPVSFGIQSPDSTTRTIKLSHVPERDSEAETDRKESGSFFSPRATKTTEGIFGDEIVESPTSPISPGKGKTRSIVDGIVSGLKSLPRAMTHSQLYDRRSSLSVGRESFRDTQLSDTRVETDMEVAHKFHGQPFVAPFGVPVLLAPAGQRPPFEAIGSPMSGSYAPPPSKADTEYTTTSGRLGGFLGELTSLPWISTRVSVDYIPGESRSGSQPAKLSSSWYTMTAPATPSDIAEPWRVLPEPWFPPAELPPPVEVHGEEERAAEEGEEGKEGLREQLDKVKEELREKEIALADLRQVVEHQKVLISSLEGELDELKKAGEAAMQAQAATDLHRRKSSMRMSLRAKDSLRASIARRTSIRVSRPASTFHD